MDNQAIEPMDNATLFYPTEEAEPLKPTAEAEDETPDESEESETNEVEGETEESEEEAGDETEEATDEEETLYLELDGEEFSLDEVKEWKAGSMMQADYTKKTQALADDRKALDADREALKASQSKLSDLSAELEVLVAEDREIDWAELKEYEPEKYIELKDKADKRKAKFEEVKANATQSTAQVLTQDELIAESNDLFESQGWKKDGEIQQEAYQNDMKLLQGYMTDAGYSNEEFKSLQYSHHFKTLLDAARYNLQKKKGSALKKKVKKAPLATKPRAKQVKAAKSAADTFYG